MNAKGQEVVCKIEVILNRAHTKAVEEVEALNSAIKLLKKDHPVAHNMLKEQRNDANYHCQWVLGVYRCGHRIQNGELNMPLNTMIFSLNLYAGIY